MEEKVQGIRSINESREGDIKNSIGNGEAKEHICMTHGHELRGDCQREWGVLGGGGQRENWDNRSSIINKIYIYF